MNIKTKYAVIAVRNFYTLKFRRIIWKPLYSGEMIVGQTPVDERYDYIQNLSTDYDTAVAKAKDYIKEHHADEDVLLETSGKADLDDISRSKKRSSAEIALEKELEEEKSEQILLAWKKMALGLIKDGISPFHPEERSGHNRRFGLYKREDFGISYTSSITNESVNFTVGFKIYETEIKSLDKDQINYYGNLSEFKSEVHEAMHKVCKPLSVYKPRNQNKFIGDSVGDLVEGRFYLTRADWIDNNFGGLTGVFHFLSEQGQKLKLNSSAKVTDDFREGEWYDLSFKVKKHIKFHDEQRDIVWKTTIVKNPKLIETREVA